MYWADTIVNQLIKSGKYVPFWVDDMKTPSGKIHVGSLRGVVIHDLLYKVLIEKGKKATFTYCINDMDPMDGFPPYLPESFRKYMGKPLCQIPAPDKSKKTFSQYYADEFIKVFNSIDCRPKIVWTHNLYKEGKFDRIIKTFLDKTDEIRKIFSQHYGKNTFSNYYPYQPICPNCGKIATTKISKWDGEYVHFSCQQDAVSYTKGCGFSGRTKPVGLAGKMPWKIEWSAHWKTLGVTIEWSGKDHMTEGGSYFLAVKICKDILNYDPPFAKLYEYLLVGGRKMSSSKGKGVSAAQMADLLPFSVLRFLLTKTHYKKTIDFNADGLTIPDLFDEYDKYADVYFKEGLKSDFGRIWQLSQVGKVPGKKPFYPRFRDVANYIQLPSIDIKQKFAQVKGDKLTQEELEILSQRVKYARIWLQNFAPKDLVYQVEDSLPQEAESLSPEQKNYLLKVIELLEEKDWNPEELQQELFELTKKVGIKPKLGFQSLYLALTGKTYGPKAAWFLLEQGKEKVKERFLQVQELKKEKQEEKESSYEFRVIKRPDLFTIDTEFKKAYPSVTVGLAVIKGLEIKKEDKKLQKEIDAFLASQSGLTTLQIGQYPQIQSYRKIYKETGVDWHSKRSSPEALLRRIAQGKGLYNINTCVDAYNLVVMKHRVSAGAFDLDKIKFPTVLRFAKKGETITLLGDEEPTIYEKGNVAYFDQVGGYNIHFNYLDAHRTRVSETTKNLLINVEGVYQISRRQVEEALKEVLQKINKYCGGKVEFVGIVK